jgi:hypothetical protein
MSVTRGFTMLEHHAAATWRDVGEAFRECFDSHQEHISLAKFEGLEIDVDGVGVDSVHSESPGGKSG